MSEPQRIAKYLSASMVASRREAERMIAAGRVKVNGKVVDTPAVKVTDTDRVEVDGHLILGASKRYVLLHKPPGVVCTREDPEGRNTVYSVLPSQLAGLAYVGRMDVNTTGVLLFTNDGDLAYRLLRPEYRVTRVYRVKVRGRVRSETAARLVDQGVLDEGEVLKATGVEVVRYLSSTTVLRLALTEGKSHEVKRMFDALGHPVCALHRDEFGPIFLGRLPEGKWRELTAREVEHLRQLVGLETAVGDSPRGRGSRGHGRPAGRGASDGLRGREPRTASRPSRPGGPGPRRDTPRSAGGRRPGGRQSAR